jgi:head-tail adaptor
MNIGQLRHRLDVDNPTQTADGDGGYTESWVAATPPEVWAAVVPATASIIERQVGNMIDAPIHQMVTCRYHAGISTRSRLTFDGRTLYVRGVQDLNTQHVWLVLACEEVTA